jgi:hypothetical protein
MREVDMLLDLVRMSIAERRLRLSAYRSRLTALIGVGAAIALLADASVRQLRRRYPQLVRRPGPRRL